MLIRKSKWLLGLATFTLLSPAWNGSVAFAQTVPLQVQNVTQTTSAPAPIKQVSNNLQLQMQDLDNILASEVVRRIMDLTRDTIELQAALKIQETETNAKMEIAEFKQDFLREELEKKSRQVQSLEAHVLELEQQLGQAQAKPKTSDGRNREVGNARVATQEMFALATEAQKKLQATHQQLHAKLLELQKANPDVIWVNGNAKDPYHENLLEINAEISPMRVQKMKLQGTLKHVEESLQAGRKPESILLMLRSAEDGQVSVDPARGEDVSDKEKLDLRLQSMREQTIILELQVKALESLAAENRDKSRRLQETLGNSRLLQSEISSIAALLDAYTQKLQSIQVSDPR